MAAGAVGDKTERKKYEFFLLKAIIAGMLRDDENFLHRVRNAGSKHPFLHGMPKEGPASAEAVDRFHWFLMPILAQFAADGIPAHGVFKAWCWLIVFLHLSACVVLAGPSARDAEWGCVFRPR